MQIDLRVYALVDPERAGGRTAFPSSRRSSRRAARRCSSCATSTARRARWWRRRARSRNSLAPFGVPLLINDRVDVALAAGADGVHVGQDDMAVEDARRLLGPQAHHRAVDQDRRAGRGRPGRSARLCRHRRRLRHDLEEQSRSADRRCRPRAHRRCLSPARAQACRSAPSPASTRAMPAPRSPPVPTALR